MRAGHGPRQSVSCCWCRVGLRDRGRQAEAAKAGEETGQVCAGEFVLPDPKYAPARFAEGAIDKAVARLVARDLFAPESGVLPALGGVERAAVPETAVDEDGEAEFGENEIGFAGEHAVPLPAGDSHCTHERDQAEFSVWPNSFFGGKRC